MNSDFIKEYWEKQAQKYKGSHEASWGDNFMIDLEIESIGKHLSDRETVLDVGCGNGYSTLCQADSHKFESIVGVDFADNMIAEANKSKQALNAADNVNFEVGDVRSLGFEDNSFDVAYTTRVIINLANWEQQTEAINECLRVVKPGGKVIFSEAFWEPLVLLNSLRTLKQLPALVEHDFNRYIKKKKMEEFLNSKGLRFEVDDFSSVYYLGSRFLRELITDISQYEGFTNPINKIFYELERTFSGGGFGIQQIYLIHK